MAADTLTLLSDLADPATAALAAGAAGAAAGPLIARYAAARAARCPVDADGDAEQTALAALLADPRRVPHMWALVQPRPDAAPRDHADADARMFAHPPHQRILDAAADRWRALGLPTPTDAQLDGDGEFSWDVHDREPPDAGEFVSAVAAALDDDAAGALRRLAGRGDPGDEEALAAGGRVLGAWHDRRTHRDPSPLRATGDADAPLRRDVPAVSASRGLAAAVFAAASFAAAAGLAAAAWPGETAAAGLAAGAAVLVAATSLFAALVDRDSLRIDLGRTAALYAGAWGVAVAAAVVGGQLWRLLAAAITVVPLLVALELVGWLFRRRRGVDGLGFGDTVVVAGAVGVATALSGEPAVGVWGFLAGFVGAGVGHVLGRLRDGEWRGRPAVPWLAAGWLIGWAAHTLAVTLLPGALWW